MAFRFILASSSQIRARLLSGAGLSPDIVPARIDEDTIRQSLQGVDTEPRDVADALAEAKARKVGLKYPEALVLGCDQIAAQGDVILTKPTSPDMAKRQLQMLSGQDHALYSAAVLYHLGQPVWRHTGKVTLTMHSISDAYLESYLERNWASVQHSVGAYKLEEEGVRLFSAIQGDFFHVLGLPLVELLSYLTERGELEI